MNQNKPKPKPGEGKVVAGVIYVDNGISCNCTGAQNCNTCRENVVGVWYERKNKKIFEKLNDK